MGMGYLHGCCSSDGAGCMRLTLLGLERAACGAAAHVVAVSWTKALGQSEGSVLQNSQEPVPRVAVVSVTVGPQPR